MLLLSIVSPIYQGVLVGGHLNPLSARQEIYIFGLNSIHGRLGTATTLNIDEPQQINLQALENSNVYKVAAIALGSQAAYVLIHDFGRAW